MFAICALLGFLLGSTALLILFTRILYVHHLVYFLRTPLPSLKKPPELQRELIDELERLDDEELGQEETCEWLNTMIRWFWNSLLLPTKPIRELREMRYAESISELLRKPITGSVLKEANLEACDVGAGMPTVKNLRVLKREAGLVAFSADVFYEDGLAYVARLVTILSIIRFKIKVHRLEGRLILVFKGNTWYYGLRTSPSLKLRANLELRIGEYKVPWFEKYLSRWISEQAFKFRMLLPRMRAKWLFDDPNKTPSN